MSLYEIRNAVCGRTVLVTGHSGFKGGWLTLWLTSLGAEVVGIGLPPNQGEDSLFARARIDDACQSYWQDILDAAAVRAIFHNTAPEFVFHLAAQPLVRRAYRDPLHTFATNVMGTAN